MKLNDLDLKNWRQYNGDITTDALWLTPQSPHPKFNLPKRDIFKSIPKEDNGYHGKFIPEIPYQFIQRFTKKGEIVWDCFAGVGTTHYIAEMLGRRCICNDLNPRKPFILRADSTTLNPLENVQLLIMHPPYWDAIQYSTSPEDGCNMLTLKEYESWFDKVVVNTTQYLDRGRFLVLVCGNLYKDGEEITLGYYAKEIIRRRGFKLKSHIIKDYGETKSGNFGKLYNLNYYRQLKGNYNNFYGDNIFLLQKVSR